jgi:hypothetical protein
MRIFITSLSAMHRHYFTKNIKRKTKESLLRCLTLAYFISGSEALKSGIRVLHLGTGDFNSRVKDYHLGIVNIP